MEITFNKTCIEVACSLESHFFSPSPSEEHGIYFSLFSKVLAAQSPMQILMICNICCFFQKKKWNWEKGIMAQPKATSLVCSLWNFELPSSPCYNQQNVKIPNYKTHFLLIAWVHLQNERAKLASSWAFWDLRYIDNRKDHCMVTEIKHLSTQRSLYSTAQQFHLGLGAPSYVVAV